ncbi:MAG: hypothetical protein K6F07_01370 [Bacilli bacterium]|nr:hypothetical protein [Bacilli bacterium]
MSMKRGYCIKCHYDDSKRHIFPVNSESAVCYCPHCMAEYKPKDAIAHYNHFMKGLITDADDTLHIAMLPESSYQKYADVLEIEDDNVQALLGRSISLLYLSTLRKSTFKQVILLNKIDENRYHLMSNRDDYFNTLRAADAIANAYEEKVLKRLTFKGAFFDRDCVKLYISRLNELIEFKDYLVEELNTIDRNQEASFVANNIALLQAKLGGKFVLPDGDVVVYHGIDRFGSIQLMTLKEKVKTGLDKYRGSTLNQDDRKLIVIKDIIFKSNKAAYRLIKIGFVLGIVFGVLGIFSAVIALPFIKKLPWLSLLLFIVGGVFLLGGISLMILQFVLKRSLKKKHL